MDPDIIHDPVFQQLLLQHGIAGRKLRNAVIAMRSFYLKHDKSPQEDTTTEKWRGAILSEDASAKFTVCREAAAELLRYAYEIAPKGSLPAHMDEVRELKAAHRERLARGRGWTGHRKTFRGIEERVRIDDGAPVTVIIKPSAYEFTARARRRKPAIKPSDSSVDEASGESSDADDVHTAPKPTGEI